MSGYVVFPGPGFVYMFSLLKLIFGFKCIVLYAVNHFFTFFWTQNEADSLYCRICFGSDFTVIIG